MLWNEHYGKVKKNRKRERLMDMVKSRTSLRCQKTIEILRMKRKESENKNTRIISRDGEKKTGVRERAKSLCTLSKYSSV